MRRSVSIAALTLVGVWMPAADPAGAADVTLSLRFRDSGGTQLSVRAGVFAGDVSYPTGNPGANLYQSRGDRSYFYTGGNVSVVVPAGPVTIRAGRGFEFEVLDTTLTVTSSRTLTFRLNRIINMKNLGWYSGDTHVHISHPPVVYSLDAQDLALVARAEELNFINSMEESEYFTGTIDPVSTSDRIVFFSKEQRNAHFSHLSILGMKQWIYDSAGCDDENVACGSTLDASIYAQAHAQPGEIAVIATHPFSTFDHFDIEGWPGVGMWRGMPVDLAAGTVDAMDLLCYTSAVPPAGVEPYFQALNAGFRLPPAAGTDCGLGSGTSGPAGGFRVYVDPVGTFTMDSWIAGLKAGRSFVTNYPLFTAFNVEGAVPGDVLTVNEATLSGTVSVRCRLPIHRVEIWGDTGLLDSMTPPNGTAKSFTASFDVASAGLTWVVARVLGLASGWHAIPAGGLFAQTAPIYLERSTAMRDPETRGVSYTRAQAAEYFLVQVDETETVFNALGSFPNGSRESFDLAIASARAFYQTLAGTPTDVGSPALPEAWALRNVWPNPFAGDVHIDYTSPDGGGEHTVAIYDVAGRVVNVLFSGRRDGGDHRLGWD
ncbi:MAG TPA: CehA/McbA family metallohydrolase, partial [Candidatus Krumholzibacteria bacterium]|nr:CehA/McbA family metallohydrolase [Candidatus Krumholzibacteria bacterium]